MSLSGDFDFDKRYVTYYLRTLWEADIESLAVKIYIKIASTLSLPQSNDPRQVEIKCACVATIVIIKLKWHLYFASKLSSNINLFSPQEEINY